jgi:hypothetical protein
MPTWVLRGLGVVVPLMSAIAEMAYLWEAPFLVDDSRFRRTFGVDATPVEEAVRQTISAWAQAA